MTSFSQEKLAGSNIDKLLVLLLHQGKETDFLLLSSTPCLSHTSLAPPNTIHRSTCQAATTSDETDSGFSGCKEVGDTTECCSAQALNREQGNISVEAYLDYQTKSSQL